MSNTQSVALNGGLKPFVFTLPVNQYRSLPIPSIKGAKVGDCFVKVTDLPLELQDFMSVNPRVPNRSKRNLLTGPVVKGIKQTLVDNPDDMAIKNQGIYILVEKAEAQKAVGGAESVIITLSDKEAHGIVNGGHTFASIREAIENADETELESISRAYVRIHLLQGISSDKVPEMAEGLNRSKQVDDPSLENLKDQFEKIQEVMKGHAGADQISYHQGDEGEMYITEVLVLLEMFNGARFTTNKHPQSLYNSPKNGLKYYKADLEKNPTIIDGLISILPEILKLHDRVKKAIPEAAKQANFTFGLMKNGKLRTGNARNKNTPLPFIGSKMDHRVPNGWLYPMLAAFRANLDFDSGEGRPTWLVPPQELLSEVIVDLVRVCVSQHNNNMQPDKVGKQESVYSECFLRVENNLLRRRVI